MAELIDKTYGEALFQLSLEEGKVEQYADEVWSIKEAIAENPEFMVLLDHPQITREEKVEVMRNCLDVEPLTVWPASLLPLFRREDSIFLWEWLIISWMLSESISILA